jgi:putative chitinase
MKYRGRGFNGITFKNTYKKYGDMIGVDLVKYPEKLGDPVIAAKVNAIYFAQGLQNKIIINKYGNKK